MNNANWRTNEEQMKVDCEMAARQKTSLADQCCAAREQTVGEYFDDRIHQTQRVVDALRDLKASLPGSFLGSGASRIAALTLPR